jgi:hypothetical protein
MGESVNIPTLLTAATETHALAFGAAESARGFKNERAVR